MQRKNSVDIFWKAYEVKVFVSVCVCVFFFFLLTTRLQSL